MVKLVQCIRRKPGLTTEQFREAWEAYGEKLRVMAIELGAVRVVLSTTLETPLNEALSAARGSVLPFDGVAEVIWQRGSDILADARLPATRQRIALLRGFQETFADVGRSAFFFAHQQDMLDAAE